MEVYNLSDKSKGIKEVLNSNSIIKEKEIKNNNEKKLTKFEKNFLDLKNSSICRIKIINIKDGLLEVEFGTSFFCEINENNIPFKNALFTSNHLLGDKNIKINQEIEFFHLKKTNKINLTNRKIFTNEKLDYTCIEIFDSDKIIGNFFKIDKTIFNQNKKDLKNTKIILLQFPGCNDLIPSIGKIIKINNEIMHNASTSYGSSGAPIIKRDNINLILGIHSGCSREFNYNLAKPFDIIIKDIKDKIKKNQESKISKPKNENYKRLEDIKVESSFKCKYKKPKEKWMEIKSYNNKDKFKENKKKITTNDNKNNKQKISIKKINEDKIEKKKSMSEEQKQKKNKNENFLKSIHEKGNIKEEKLKKEEEKKNLEKAKEKERIKKEKEQMKKLKEKEEKKQIERKRNEEKKKKEEEEKVEKLKKEKQMKKEENLNIKNQKNEISCIFSGGGEIDLLHDYKMNLDDWSEEYKKLYLESKEQMNEKNIDIYINNKKINFTLSYYDKTQNKNINVKFIFKQKLTNLSWMFADCSSLKSIDLSKFNSTNVTNMKDMFYSCISLESINLSKFNSTNVTNMSWMFYNCLKLESIDLSSFNTINVKDMNHMFSCCLSLHSIDLSSFNTINVKNMESMFYSCSCLKNINLSSFNTTYVSNMKNMFSWCSSLVYIDLSSFNTHNVTDMRNMFSECCSLKSIDISSFTITNVKKMESMFAYSSSLKMKNIKCKDDKFLQEYLNELY